MAVQKTKKRLSLSLFKLVYLFSISFLLCSFFVVYTNADDDSVNGDNDSVDKNVEDATTTSPMKEEEKQEEEPKQSASSEESSTPTTEQETKKKAPVSEEIDPERDWGTYYDPQNVFCGKYDCYKILALGDYEELQTPPTTKEITQNYRRLSREWHPDKSKHKNAKEIFVKIARAYEVLVDKKKRKEYDFMRYNQEAYFQTYGTSVLWNYAPKSDAAIISIVLLILANVFSWYAQQNRWSNVANRLVKAAVEDWSPSQGGTPESKQLREEALALLKQREKEKEEEEKAALEKEKGGDNNTKSNATKLTNNKKKEKKVPGKERKKQEQEALLPIIWELVNEMHDFGSGFHKPTWEDLLIISLVKLPFKIGKGVIWQSKYYARRLRGIELNDEEKEILTARAVGPVIWDTSTDEERAEMISLELWILSNLAEWKEEQEIKNLSRGEQKYIQKMMKKEKNKKE